jgi:3-phosphoshikimate 1-carboxyvinyltransferase
VLTGSFICPPDKSISHRAAILAAIATGKSTLHHFLFSEDCLATLQCLRQLGVEIALFKESNTVVIEGVGLQGLRESQTPLHCGNSGTTIRLLSGILAAQPFSSTLMGDESLSQRPMGRVTLPLKQMGAEIKTQSPDYRAPIEILPLKKALSAIHYAVPVASAQVQASLLFAGLYASGTTKVTVPSVVRDHSLHLLRQFGADISQDALTVSITPAEKLNAQTLWIPGDLSSAAFFIVGALIAKEGCLSIKQVGINPTRSGILTLLQKMGADLLIQNQQQIAGEWIADIHVKSAALHGIEINPRDVSLCIDELPLLLLAASCAEGRTTLRGAQELRVKESDRLHAMAVGLRTLGVSLELYEDGMIIHGLSKSLFEGGFIDSFHDHRIAMTFIMASRRSKQPITVSDCDYIATSFPHFFTLAQQMGFEVSTNEESILSNE